MLTDEDKYKLNTDLESDKYQLNDNFEGFIQGLGLLTRLHGNKGYPVVTINKKGGRVYSMKTREFTQVERLEV